MVVKYLRHNYSGGLRAFSLDIDCLYHSLPQVPLLQNAKDCISNQDAKHAFTTRSGVSVGGFLEVLPGFDVHHMERESFCTAIWCVHWFLHGTHSEQRVRLF